MKIAGRKIKGPNRVTLVLPREDEEDIVIITEAISDMGEFDKYLEPPQPPAATGKGGVVTYNYDDKDYKIQMLDFNLKKMAWILLKSLAPSNIEWETVELDNPSTWLNYLEEMKASGFSSVEVNRVSQASMQANALDESKLEEARQVFLRGQAEETKSTSGPQTQPQNS